jgi:uncharacterized membrane protein YoaK (UPF0700 family)
LVTGFAGIAAMAIQNAVQRVHFAGMPPTTIMTGNTTQATLDAIDLMRGAEGDQAAAVRARFYQQSAAFFSSPLAAHSLPSFMLGLASGALRFRSLWPPQAPS